MPSISSSVADQSKNSDDTDVPEDIQQNNTSSDDEDNTTNSANKSVAKGRGRKATPSQNTNDKRNSKLSKELPDENENCRVSTIYFDSNLWTHFY